MKTEKEAYEHWRDTFLFGALKTLPPPATDEDRAWQAWAEARAAVFRSEPFPEMEVDPERWAEGQLREATGIYIRAKVAGKYESVDIAVLKTESLKAWLRSRGGSNPWAESTVLLMLGHKV